MKTLSPLVTGALIVFVLYIGFLMRIKHIEEMYPEPAKEGCYIGSTCT